MGVSLFFTFGLKKISEHYLSELFRSNTTIDSYSINWLNFPTVIFFFDNLTVAGTLKQNPDSVLAARRVTLKLDCKQFLAGWDTITIDKIQADSMNLQLKVDNQGNKNFQLFQPYSPNQHSPGLIRVKQCIFLKTHLNYQFFSKNRNYHFDLDSANLSYDIYKHDIDFVINTYGKIDSLQEDETAFLHNQPVQIDLQFNYRKRDKNLTFKKGNVWISSILFEVFGSFLTGKERYYNLDFQVKSIQFSKLLSLLPRKVTEQLDFFEAKGDFKISGKIHGKDDLVLNPYTELSVQCKDAKLLDSKKKEILYDFSFDMRYDNGTTHNAAGSMLTINANTHFNSKLPFNLWLKITRFEQMFADISVQGIIPFKPFANLIFQNQILSASGLAKINFTGQAPLKYIAKLDSLHLLKTSGNLELNDIEIVGFLNPNIDISLPYGQLNFSDNKLVCNKLNLTINHQKFYFAGSCENFLPYFTGNTAYLATQFKLETPSLSVDSLLNIKNISFSRKKVKRAKSTVFSIPNRVLLRGSVNANQLSFKQYHLDQLSLSTTIDSGQKVSLHLFLKQQNDSILLTSNLLQSSEQISFKGSAKIIVQDISQTYSFWASKRPQKSKKVFSFQQDLNFWGNFSGDLKKKNANSLNLFVQGLDGVLNHPNPKFSLKDIHFETEITDKMLNKSSLQGITIRNIGAVIDDHLLSASVKVQNFENPTLSLDLSANLSLPAIMAHLPKLPIEAVRGKINFGLSATFPMTHLAHFDSLMYINSSGFVTIDSISFTLISNKLRFKNICSRIGFDANSTQIEQIYGKIGTCSFRGKANTKELLPYIFLKNKELVASLSFYGDTLNLQELLAQDNQKPEKGLAFGFPDLLNLSGDFSFQSIYYEKFRLNNPAAKVIVNQQLLTIDTIHAGICNGQINGKLSVNTASKKVGFVKGNAIIEKVDLQKLFYSLNNFSQEFITDKNLSGKLTAHITYEDSVPYDFKTDFMDQKAIISVNIQEGKLDSFSLLNKLSPFVSKDILKHTRFTMQADSMLINQRIVYIPKLNIYSNLINLALSGYQTYDLDMNYFVWFERVKRRREMKEKLQITPHFLKTILTFKITGSYPNIRFKYDMSLAWKRIWNRESIYKHGKRLKLRNTDSNKLDFSNYGDFDSD